MELISLQNERDFYKDLVEACPYIICLLRKEDLRIVFANEHFVTYFGYSIETLLNNDIRFFDILGVSQHSRLLHQLSKVDRGINVKHGFSIYKMNSLSEGMLDFFVRPTVFEHPVHGNCYYLMISPDRSVHKMPFLSFDTSELFLEQFKNEDFGTFEWLIQTDTVYWSEGVYRIYEIDESDDKFGRTFVTTFTHPNYKEHVEKVFHEAMVNGEPLEIEYKIITTKKTTKVIHALGKRIDDKDGQPIKFIGSIRDITDRRIIEEDLRNKVEKLNQSNRELEEFAYVASHDMQEPLRKITTFSSRLQEKYSDVLTGEGAMYLTRMAASAENMRKLINDLLEFSRISNTQQPVQTISLNVVLREVKTDLELVIEDTGTTINSVTLPLVPAIYSQMKQIYSNIISNAIKFHKAGTPPVIDIAWSFLSTEQKLKLELNSETEYYQIHFKDNGIGFDTEYSQKIFNIFQRLHGRSEYPGTGIGLAICKKIVEHHKGKIYAQSTQGEGATFTVILPTTQ